MKTVKQTLVFFSMLVLTNSIFAATDISAQQKFLEARVSSHQQEGEHTNHLTAVEEGKKFHGVFYGFLPCDNCNGIKSTLSLKDNNNYLLVTQPAKESSREFYEKGKYSWDNENKLVLLTPKNHEATTRQYRIKDEGTLIQLNDDGTQATGADLEKYTLRRSDTVKSREVHIH